jgi:hypothetical protein
MWSFFPMLAAFAIFVVYFIRLISATISATFQLSKEKDSYGESPYGLHMAAKARKLKAQHVSAALLLSYLVLPPVAVRVTLS